MSRRPNFPADTPAPPSAPDEIRTDELPPVAFGADLPAATRFLAALAARRASHGHPLAVAVLHVDRFGHASASLGAIRAARLRDMVGARVSGRLPAGVAMQWVGEANLAVVTCYPAGIHDTARLGAELANVLAPPFVIDGFELFLSYSIGVGEDSTSLPAERSLQQAYDAMLRVSRRGGNGTATTATGTPPGSARLLDALPDAIARGELAVHLQPRAHFDTATVTSYAGRLRWLNPELGQVPPEQFNPALETLGMMGDVARWVLRTMIPLVRAPDVDPAIELVMPAPSAQLHCIQMVDALRHAIDAFGVAAHRLCIEVPVAAVPADGYIASQFDPLRQRGVRLALSDFSDNPAGRSALSRLAPDRVTLDVRALAQPCPSAIGAALRAACDHALGTGASVCAKGVDTRWQMAAVREWGCDSMQGYLLSQSFPARWLAQTHPALQQRARELIAELSHLPGVKG